MMPDKLNAHTAPAPSVQLPAATSLSDIPFACLGDIGLRRFSFTLTRALLLQLVLRTAGGRRAFARSQFILAARPLSSIRHGLPPQANPGLSISGPD